MFDNICTLPLSSDAFTQALHPTLPILSVGLSSGHIHTFRLPSSSSFQKPWAKGTQKSPPGDGFDVIETAWRTRRHQGSCRTACFSLDGETLYSAGTDGLCKAASSETGRVVAKAAIPSHTGKGGRSNGESADEPSVLHALSPQALLLGTDAGKLHVYDLRLKHGARPAQSLQPHVPKGDPEADKYSEPITSISALAPTAASTSGTSKVWVTTSGGTLAVTDLRKGVIALSVAQEDPLFSSLSIAGKTSARNNEKLVAGTAGGALTIWERGQWEDRVGSVAAEPPRLKGPEHDGTVDSLAHVPREDGEDYVAAGLGNGTIQLVRIKGRGGEWMDRLLHDERTIEGVTALGFDVEGRMISAGGPIVKVWCEEQEWSDDEEREEADESDDDGSDGSDDIEDEEGDVDNEEQEDDDDGEADELAGGDEDEDDVSGSSEEEDEKRRKKRKKNSSQRQGNHGIFGSYDLD